MIAAIRSAGWRAGERGLCRWRVGLGVELHGEVFQAAVDLDGDYAVPWAESAGDADGGGEVGSGGGPGEDALGAGGLVGGTELAVA